MDLSEQLAASRDVTPVPGCALRLQQLGGCYIVRLVGEIDTPNASLVKQHLCSIVELGHVVIDLSEVTLIASAGLNALVATDRRTAKCGTSVHLAGAEGNIRRILQLTDVARRLDYHDSLADAVEAALASRDRIQPPAHPQP